MSLEREEEYRNHGMFEIGPPTDVASGNGESLPDDRFADAGGDKQIYSGFETVVHLEELVEGDGDEGGDDEPDDGKAKPSTKVTGVGHRDRLGRGQ